MLRILLMINAWILAGIGGALITNSNRWALFFIGVSGAFHFIIWVKDKVEEREEEGDESTSKSRAEN